MCHSEAVMEGSCWLHIYVFQEIPGTCRKNKKTTKTNFNHRLGACYNLGIYIYMLTFFLLLFVLRPSQLFSALEQLRLDEKVRVVVFKSEVKGVFCAGK